VIEKTWNVKGGLDGPLSDAAGIIYNEVKDYLDENESKKKIVAYFKKEFKHADFVSKVYEVAGCKVVYNLVKLRDQLSMSSAFDLPRNGSHIKSGPFEMRFRMEQGYLCLDTSRATDVIQFHMGLEGFSAKIGEPKDDTLAKPSEIFKFFEENEFKLEGDKTWTKYIRNSAGRIETQIYFEGQLDSGVNQYHLDMVSVLIAMVEAE
jgi:hypothetical protein